MSITILRLKMGFNEFQNKVFLGNCFISYKNAEVAFGLQYIV